MTYKEKKERNDQIFREHWEAKMRGEKNINEKLAAKYHLHEVTISRAIKEAERRNQVESVKFKTIKQL